jgi:hypothetical protein
MIQNVQVEKYEYFTGTVAVEANTLEEAIAIVDEKIEKGRMQSCDVDWDDGMYEAGTFKSTGDEGEDLDEDEDED